MERELPPRPNLERLRREARALQRACVAGDAGAAARVAAEFADTPLASLPLTKAQAVVAREYGLASWPALIAAVEARRAAAMSDADMLAEQWFALAEAEDLRPLGRALQIGKTRKQGARAVMRRQTARYRSFQQALVRGLGARRDRVRFMCAAELDTFGDATTRPPLARLMDDPVPRVRWMAMHALSCHGCGEKPGALEPQYRERIVQAAMSDPSVRVRHHAAVGLGLMGDLGAAPMLRELLAHETDARLVRGVTWALAELGRRPRPDKAGRRGV
jgi:hypothetical protein